jgi:hypothetical protein
MGHDSVYIDARHELRHPQDNSAGQFHPARCVFRATFSRGQPMSTEDNPEKSREESPEWHRAWAERLRKNGFTKMAEKQLAQAIRAPATGAGCRPPTEAGQ